MFSRLASAVLAFELLLAASAGAAATSVTPAIHSDVSRVGCVVQNRGKVPRSVTATLHNLTGVPIATFSLEVPPGLSIEMVSTSVFQVLVWCSFEGTSRKVRGSLQVQPLGGGTTQLVVPAD
jgi:hypothetical protein